MPYSDEQKRADEKRLEALRALRAHRMQVKALIRALLRYRAPVEYRPTTGGYVIRFPHSAALFWSPTAAYDAAVNAGLIEQDGKITDAGKHYEANP